MKISILLLALSTLFSFANAQDGFISKITLDKTTQAKYLKKVIPLDNYCIFLEESEDTIGSFLEIHQFYDQNFQFYQTNSDDTLFIFDGKLCGGHESGVVNVCLFSNGEPTTVVSRGGKVAGIENDQIWIYTYPCCAEILNLIVPFSLKTGEKLDNAHVFYSRYDYVNVFPLKEKKEQYQLTKETEIRWSPFDTDQIYAPICESRENIIGKLSKGKPFTLIHVASNGWALIRLENMSTSEGYCIGEHHQKLIQGDEYTLYGWVPVSSVKWE